MQRGAFFGAGRLINAFPRMRHGRRHLPLNDLRRHHDPKDGDKPQS